MKTWEEEIVWGLYDRDGRNIKGNYNCYSRHCVWRNEKTGHIKKLKKIFKKARSAKIVYSFKFCTSGIRRHTENSFASQRHSNSCKSASVRESQIGNMGMS